MEISIRMATEADADAVLEVYAPFCTGTAVTFEEAAPSLADMRDRIHRTLVRFPWLVAEGGGGVLGYAYSGLHRDRASYRWSADVTVYIAPKGQRKGIGRRFYSILLPMLTALGYYKAFAGITLPNAGSVGLHEACGFTHLGVYRKVGYKLGAWHDVGYWELDLQPSWQAPAETRALSDLSAEEIGYLLPQQCD